MKLNNVKPAAGSKTARKRVGRGIGSGLGKTAGRGHKGQHSRSGGYHKVGFEGGQLPIQRRLPKVGFATSANRFTGEVRLYQLDALKEDVVDIEVLKAAKVVSNEARKVKVIARGEIQRAVTIKGLAVSAGAKKAIEAAGGQVQ